MQPWFARCQRALTPCQMRFCAIHTVQPARRHLGGRAGIVLVAASEISPSRVHSTFARLFIGDKTCRGAWAGFSGKRSWLAGWGSPSVAVGAASASRAGQV